MRFFFQAGIIGSVWDQPWSLGSSWAQVWVIADPLLCCPRKTWFYSGQAFYPVCLSSLCWRVHILGGSHLCRTQSPWLTGSCLPIHLWWQLVPHPQEHLSGTLSQKPLKNMYLCLSVPVSNMHQATLVWKLIIDWCNYSFIIMRFY